MSAWQLHLIDDKAPPAARVNSEVVILTPKAVGTVSVEAVAHSCQ